MSKHVTVRLNRRGSLTSAGLLAPHRGDQVAEWLKAHRDAAPAGVSSDEWLVLDGLLDEYRLRADLGLTLDAEIPEEAMR